MFLIIFFVIFDFVFIYTLIKKSLIIFLEINYFLFLLKFLFMSSIYHQEPPTSGKVILKTTFGLII